MNSSNAKNTSFYGDSKELYFLRSSWDEEVLSPCVILGADCCKEFSNEVSTVKQENQLTVSEVGYHYQIFSREIIGRS